MLEGKVLDGYLFERLLGKGAFADVWRASKDGVVFAIKVVGDKHGEASKIRLLLDEKFNHPFLVKHFSEFKSDEKFFFVTELCANGGLDDLVSYLDADKGVLLSELRVMKIFIQLLLGLEFLHRNNILHRDLKSFNILVDGSNNVKLGGGSVIVLLEPPLYQVTDLVGTYSYMAPEIFQDVPYSFPADVWSLGVLLYELCTTKLPFKGSMFQVPSLVQSGKYAPMSADTCSAEVIDLVASILKVTPSERPTARDLLKNPHVLKFAEKLDLKKFFPTDL